MERLTDAPDERLPVSLLTGFLGSGKTTVLNRLLRHPDLARTAVIINEFGEIGLDHDLVESTTDELMLLQSGCLCCTIRSDLVDALRDLFLRRVRGEVPPFERVVIETTGLADPAPILHALMTDPLVEARYRIDGIITTVDAATGMATLNRQSESLKQIALADRLLLTKTDLAPVHRLSALMSRLALINPVAPVIHTVNGEVDPDALFNAGPYNAKTKVWDVRRWLRADAIETSVRRDPSAPPGAGRGGFGAVASRHDDRIRALCLAIDEPIPVDAFNRWLDALFLLKGPDLMRIKGIANILDLDRPVVIHGVQHIFHPITMLARWPTADRRSRFVFIGRDLEEGGLRDLLSIFANACSGTLTETIETDPDRAQRRAR